MSGRDHHHRYFTASSKRTRFCLQQAFLVAFTMSPSCKASSFRWLEADTAKEPAEQHLSNTKIVNSKGKLGLQGQTWKE